MATYSTLVYPTSINPCHFLNSHKPHNLYTHKLSKLTFSFFREHKLHNPRKYAVIINKSEPDPEAQEEVDDVGVKVALSMLKFYKREISPLLPRSCRYVPTCSEYSMIAYKKYGVAKGSILTAWRLCRCNPLGGSGFDPPRWFGEERPPEE